MILIKKKKNYDNHSRKILANNIVYFRLKLNWSQEDLAEELGTTPTYVSNLENAKRNMRVDYIGHIANTLKVSVQDLFRVEEKKSKITENLDNNLNNRVILFLYLPIL